MQVYAVIGANYGDEGKGLVTDALSNSSTLVVRFNGGAQAGHTVVSPDGRRHPFSHVGSGSFQGAVTLLAREFIVHPLVLRAECDELRDKGVWPNLFIDHHCRVTTPYDQAINQLAERSRGTEKHGSVGLGINETVTRSDLVVPANQQEFLLTAEELFKSTVPKLREKLMYIEEQYVPARCDMLGLDPAKLKGIQLRSWIATALWMRQRCTLWNDVDLIANDSDHIVFEGAQGLALDQNRGDFPYVTRSNTGIKNVVTLLNDVGIDFSDLKTIYVTRAYLTRHGPGPLPLEVEDKRVLGDIEDLTNQPNEWQGALRFAPLDLMTLMQRIYTDMQKDGDSSIAPSIAMTCLDQLPGRRQVIASELREFTGWDVHESWGPTRDTFHMEGDME